MIVCCICVTKHACLGCLFCLFLKADNYTSDLFDFALLRWEEWGNLLQQRTIISSQASYLIATSCKWIKKNKIIKAKYITFNFCDVLAVQSRITYKGTSCIAFLSDVVFGCFTSEYICWKRVLKHYKCIKACLSCVCMQWVGLKVPCHLGCVISESKRKCWKKEESESMLVAKQNGATFLDCQLSHDALQGIVAPVVKVPA